MRRTKHEGVLLEKMKKEIVFLFPAFAQQSGRAMAVKFLNPP